MELVLEAVKLEAFKDDNRKKKRARPLPGAGNGPRRASAERPRPLDDSGGKRRS